MSRMKIGWASRDISTDKPLNMPGQFHMRISRGVLDPVTVTALVVENGGDPVIFLSGDFIDCRSHMLDELRAAMTASHPEIPADRILVNATHTHTGASHVNGIGAISFTPGEAFNHDGVEIASPEAYRAFLVNQMHDAICEAWETRSEGGISYGYGYAVVGFNRRVVYFDDLSLREGAVKNSTHGVNGHVKMYGDTTDPNFSHYEAGSDAFVNLMFTFDAQNQLTGAIINIPCPSQNSEYEYYLSADYWHEVRLAIRKKYGNIFILPQCAAAGDLSPKQLHYKAAKDRRFRLKYGEIETKADNKERIMNRMDIAERVCAAFDEVYAWAKKDIVTDPVVAHSVRMITLPKRLITDEQYRQALEGYAREQGAAFTYDGTPLENLHHNSMVMSRRGRYKRIIDRYEKQQTEHTLPMELHTIRIGDIAFASNRFEIFMDYQHRIQARSPFLQTFVVQLSAQPDLDNGTYLPTERGLWGRGFGASEYDNLVTPAAGQIIVEETLKDLKKLSEQ